MPWFCLLTIINTRCLLQRRKSLDSAVMIACENIEVRLATESYKVISRWGVRQDAKNNKFWIEISSRQAVASSSSLGF
ncbi:hypothetical protein ACU8KH_02118 [Lachancea thermotolerans]